MSTRTDSSNRRTKSVIDRKVPAFTKTSQKTRSSNDRGLVKNFATRSRGTREHRLLLRKEDRRNVELRGNTNHKDCLPDETDVVSADNNNPIRILRKEIHDWRVSEQLTNELEREHRATKYKTEKCFSREHCDRVSTKTWPEPNGLFELSRSIVINHSTRCT